MVHHKHFPCGHRGLGRYCHRCKAHEQHQAKLVAARRAKAEDSRYISADGRFTVLLDAIPHPTLISKARDILTRIIDHGEAYTTFGGKRMHTSRDIISVPIGYRFRLILQERSNGEKIPIDILSHEDYNQYVRQLPELLHSLRRHSSR